MNHLLACSLLVGLGVLGCSESEPESESEPVAVGTPAVPSPEHPASPPEAEPETKDFCGALGEVVHEEPECAGLLAVACGDLSGLLSQDYLDAVSECFARGEHPAECLLGVVDELEPSAAHRRLATSFCEECALDLPGCEDLFFFGDTGDGAGLALLPLGDGLVSLIEDECTSGLSCALDFPSCVLGVLEAQLSPADAAACWLDAL